MKITAITPYVSWVGFRNQLLVKVEADDGSYGWGESGLSSREFAVEGAIRHFREFLLGRDPRRIGALWQEMYRGAYFEGGRVLTAAISAIDIALHDLVARHLGVPVYQLLGGRQRDRVECFACIPGHLPAGEIPDAARLLMREGWTSFRLGMADAQSYAEQPQDQVGPPVSTYDVHEAIDRTTRAILAAREAAGPRAVIGCDAHHRLTVAEAASFLQKLPDGALDYIEEPIRAESPEAYEALRRMTRIPFAIGEEFSSKWAFKPFIERNLLQYARIDVCNVGGLTESMKVAAMAEANYIDLLLHNPLGPICIAASVHLGAAVPNFAWLESRQSPTEALSTIDDAIFPVRLHLEGNGYPVPEGPGLGVEVNEDILKSQPPRPWEAPRFRKPDGGYTNW